MLLNKYLLASHGSIGGQTAEAIALSHLKRGDELHHLYVIPSWWADMTGDDWLNNGVSRNRFRNYLAKQLDDECQMVIERIQRQCKERGIRYSPLVKTGDSAQCLLTVTKETDYKIIFIGSRRPKEMQGLRDTMLTAHLQKQLYDKLYIVPYRNERYSAA